jgi:deazaflavin-dependent oxidoreductase (nitroreductase family)
MALLNRGAILVIESTGRRTGRRRFTPVAFWETDDGSYVVGGGAAGKTATPDWVANLRATPQASVWIHRRRIEVIGRELVGSDRDRAVSEAATIWPRLSKYQVMSGRVIPFFRLEPTAVVS